MMWMGRERSFKTWQISVVGVNFFCVSLVRENFSGFFRLVALGLLAFVQEDSCIFPLTNEHPIDINILRFPGFQRGLVS